MKNKKKDVIKHSGAIHISGEISLLERKTWNVLLANAFNDLEHQETYQISIRNLARFLRFDSNDHELLKEALRVLNKTQVEWNILEKDKEIWAATTLLSGVEIINGVCTYGYSFVLRKFLNNPSMYAKLNLFQQTLFKKKYAHILWELFKDYFDEKKGYGETPWISVEKFRKLLGLSNDEYTLFKDLNKWVIKKAIKEINEVSDLYVDLKNGIKQRKDGRKIGALKFHIKRNPNNTIDFSDFDNLALPDKPILPDSEFKIDNQPLFETLTADFGISNNKALEILKTKDEFYIQEVLNTVREEIDAGKVKNIPAFTVKALEDDYRRKKNKTDLEKEEKQEIKKQEQEKVRQEQEIINRLKAGFDKQREAEIKKLLQKMSDDEKVLLIIEKGSSFVRKSYHKKGLESESVQSFLRKYTADNRLSEEEHIRFEVYAGKQGYRVVRKAGGGYKLGNDEERRNCC